LYHVLKKDIVDKFTSSANELEPKCPMLASWLRALGLKALGEWRNHSRWLYAKAAAVDAKKLAAAS
jgi:hypothetical protein